jgi:hypothetical protein
MWISSQYIPSFLQMSFISASILVFYDHKILTEVVLNMTKSARNPDVIRINSYHKEYLSRRLQLS